MKKLHFSPNNLLTATTSLSTRAETRKNVLVKFVLISYFSRDRGWATLFGILYLAVASMGWKLFVGCKIVSILDEVTISQQNYHGKSIANPLSPLKINIAV